LINVRGTIDMHDARKSKVFAVVCALVGISLVAVFCGVVFAYDRLAFSPEKAKLDQMVDRAGTTNLPPLARNLILTGHDKRSLANYVSRQVLFKLGQRGNDGMGWNIRHAAWAHLLEYHYDCRRLLVLYAELAERNGAVGFTEMAARAFAKKPENLNEHEWAELIVGLRIQDERGDLFAHQVDELIVKSKARGYPDNEATGCERDR
jgi:hypothetical protein